MTPPFTLIPERREPPDLERFAAALLAFALARLAQEEAEQAEAAAEETP